MRMSASRIRSINRSIARVNGIVCGASDRVPRNPSDARTSTASATPSRTIRIVAVAKSTTA
jgi:hypothetical protein